MFTILYPISDALFWSARAHACIGQWYGRGDHWKWIHSEGIRCPLTVSIYRLFLCKRREMGPSIPSYSSVQLRKYCDSWLVTCDWLESSTLPAVSTKTPTETGYLWGMQMGLVSIGSSKNWAEQGSSVHYTLHWRHFPEERNSHTSFIWWVSVSLWLSCEGWCCYIGIATCPSPWVPPEIVSRPSRASEQNERASGRASLLI